MKNMQRQQKHKAKTNNNTIADAAVLNALHQSFHDAIKRMECAWHRGGPRHGLLYHLEYTHVDTRAVQAQCRDERLCKDWRQVSVLKGLAMGLLSRFPSSAPRSMPFKLPPSVAFNAASKFFSTSQELTIS